MQLWNSGLILTESDILAQVSANLHCFVFNLLLRMLTFMALIGMAQSHLMRMMKKLEVSSFLKSTAMYLKVF